MTEEVKETADVHCVDDMADRPQRPVIIAIDGPAGSGKSTLAKRLAAKLGFFLLDSGALYRVMALHLTRMGIAGNGEPVPESALNALQLQIEPQIGSMSLFLSGEDVTDLIRQEEIGAAASRFSTRPEVRRALINFQRRAGTEWDLVAEGRDMGTVVFPEAAVKFFLTADLEERSSRRYLDLVKRGEHPNPVEIATEMRARDFRDLSRTESPLRKAEDAILVDTTSMDVEEVLQTLVDHIEKKIKPSRMLRRPDCEQ